MKTKLRYLIITLITIAGANNQVHANDEAVAAIGGFLAGIITGAVINDHDDYHHRGSVHISTGSSRYYSNSRCHKHGRYGCSSCSSYGHQRSGYWEIRHVKIWIPGHWEFVRNRCGDHVRIWKSGYYTTKPEKVWVSGRGHSRRGSYCD